MDLVTFIVWAPVFAMPVIFSAAAAKRTQHTRQRRYAVTVGVLVLGAALWATLVALDLWWVAPVLAIATAAALGIWAASTPGAMRRRVEGAEPGPDPSDEELPSSPTGRGAAR